MYKDIVSKVICLCFYFITTAFILITILLGGGKITFGLFLFCIILCFSITKTGEWALQACFLKEIKARLPMAFVVGFALISSLMMTLAVFTTMPQQLVFWISVFLSFILTYFFSKNITASYSLHWSNALAPLLLVIAIIILARIPISSYTTLLNTGILPIWIDYYLHGISIDSFGSPFSMGVDLELAGVNRPFYHYASFMIPAAFQSIFGMTGIALSTSLLLPLGLLIAAFGSYVLAVELAGWLGGLAAVIIIICIPVFSLIIQSGWFNFYWLLFISPGSGYAIGISTIICASTHEYLKKNNNKILWMIIPLLLSLILIRVHMFMLLAPAIFTMLILHHWRIKIKILWLAIICTILVGTFILYFFPAVKALWLELANPITYLNFNASSIYGNPINLLANLDVLTIFIRVLIILTAILGGYIVLFPLLFRFNIKKFGFNLIDLLPLLLIISFIGLMLFAPIARNGDLTEYKHRHFLLLYVIIAIYSISYAVKLIQSHISSSNKLEHWGYGSIVLIFGLTIILTWGANPASPDLKTLNWANNFHNRQIDPSVLDISSYISKHAKKGDVLAMSASASKDDKFDSMMLKIISLTGVPSFLSRVSLKMNGSQCIQNLITMRLNLLNKLSFLDHYSDVQKLLRANGIRWYIVPSDEKPQWDSNRKYAVLSTKNIFLYDLGADDHTSFKTHQC